MSRYGAGRPKQERPAPTGDLRQGTERRFGTLEIELLGNAEGVVNLDPEIPDGALELRRLAPVTFIRIQGRSPPGVLPENYASGVS